MREREHLKKLFTEIYTIAQSRTTEEFYEDWFKYMCMFEAALISHIDVRRSKEEK